MPTRIADPGIANVYRKLETQRATDPNVTIDQRQVMDLLAQVGDGPSTSASKVLQQLGKPGLTPQAQIDIAKKGMGPSEKRDLERILDTGTVPLTPGAKAFLEAVVGRAAAPATQPAGWGAPTTPVRPPTTPTTPVVVTPPTTPVVTPPPTPSAPFAANTNVLHYKGPTTFEGAKLKADVLAGAFHGISAEKFGTTDVVLPQADGTTKTVNVRDMHYDLGDGKVGMNLIPVKDHNDTPVF